MVASWYPSRVDFLNGDFVERHAKSIALTNDVTVLFASKDLQLKNNLQEFDYTEKDRLKVYKAYYREFKSPFPFLRKVVSQYRYFKCYHKLYTESVKNHGRPDFIHLYIPFKSGMYALYLKWFKNLKYVISEQHSWYMPASDKYENSPAISKWMIKKIFKNTSGVHTVSRALGDALVQKKLTQSNFRVIPNVVNPNIFFPGEKIPEDGITRFVTITGNIYHKNTDGILRAFKKVLEKRNDFILEIIGPGFEDLQDLASTSGLSKHICFHGPMTYENVAKINQRSDALIFFTRYETFGCVIIEAHACGLPVIASDLPVIRENLEGFNGIFVPSEDEAALAEKIIWFMENKDAFEQKKIASHAKNRYNYDVVGRQFDNWYQHIFQG